jgi:hypothetical protein
MDTNRYEVSYTPNAVGDFKIGVFHDDVSIDDKTYTARVFDVNKVMIYDFPTSAIVDTATYFISKYIDLIDFLFGFILLIYLVDAADSGSGNLEIAVSINEQNIPNYVQNEGGARFRVKFTPDQTGIYYIQIKFNGIDIHGKEISFNKLSFFVKLNC